jgi:hypothetical protein
MWVKGGGGSWELNKGDWSISIIRNRIVDEI